MFSTNHFTSATSFSNVYSRYSESPSAAARERHHSTSALPSFFTHPLFIDRLAESDPAAAAEFHLTFRFIDDTLSIDNPHWKSTIASGKLYPPSLRLNDTTPRDARHVQFLGMQIAARRDTNRFRFSVFDKRNSFPFVCVVTRK
jgi:hypothetical protein